MNLKIKKYVPFILVLVAIVILSGTSYALLKSTSKGSNPYVMNVGVLEISFQDSEEDKLTLVNQIPISDEEGIASEEEYEFTIKNTGTLPATYNVYIEETSTNPEFKSVIRYITNKNDEDYGDPKTLSEDKYIDTNATLGIDETATYKVKLWLSIDADSTYMNKTFTARIVVDTTLNYDGFSSDTEKLVEDNVVNYATASASNFSGGLVAINTDGTLYNENDTTQTIREYRYSGPTVNNYIFFDTDGDTIKDDNEIWRIIGVFKNSSDEWNIKITRNRVLSEEELPSTYTYNEINFDIKDYKLNVFWNSNLTGVNYSDWTTAGLQYWLNGTDGYFGRFTSDAKELIDTNYTYYLGNVNDIYDTVISSYINERKNVVCDSSLTEESHKNNCNIWYGNKATWQGGISLLYFSDILYTVNSNHWNSLAPSDWQDGVQQSTSWFMNTMNSVEYYDKLEYTLNPYSYNRVDVISWAWLSITPYSCSGTVRLPYGAGMVRPTLNLLSTIKIENNDADGSETKPYVLVLN